VDWLVMVNPANNQCTIIMPTSLQSQTALP